MPEAPPVEQQRHTILPDGGDPLLGGGRDGQSIRKNARGLRISTATVLRVPRKPSLTIALRGLVLYVAGDWIAIQSVTPAASF